MGKRVYVFVGAACMLLCSCGGDAGALRSGDTYVIIGSDDGTNRAGVGVSGTVAVSGKCLGIDSAVTIWPPETRIVSDEPLVIEVPGLGRIKVGDRIKGGGYASKPSKPPSGIQVPSSCQNRSLFSFFPDS